MEKAVSDIVEKAYSVFANQDMRAAEEIEPLEEVIDELSRELKRRHVNRLRAGECTIEMGFVLSDITTSLERIADHCSNIGVCVTQVHEDLYDTHSHLDTVKNDTGRTFPSRTGGCPCELYASLTGRADVASCCSGKIPVRIISGGSDW